MADLDCMMVAIHEAPDSSGALLSLAETFGKRQSACSRSRHSNLQEANISSDGGFTARYKSGNEQIPVESTV